MFGLNKIIPVEPNINFLGLRKNFLIFSIVAILLSIGLNDSAKVGRPDGRPQLSVEGFRYGLKQLLREIKIGITVDNFKYVLYLFII